MKPVQAFKARVDQDFTQGNVVKTDNPLDVAIGPQGLFKVEMAKMIDYQRMFETYTKSMKTFDKINSNK